MAHEGQKTILLVEDEPVIAMVQGRLLERHGYRVERAGSGEEAIKAVNRGGTIDLILMDINLGPGIDGTEAAETILKTHDLPLVFLSSHTEPEIVERTDGITSYGYIVKNSGETVLLASIKMAFRLFEARLREKTREAELRESEYFFMESQRVAQVGSFRTDLKGGAWYSSAMLDQIFGIDKGFERSVDTWLSLIHPDDVAAVDAEVRAQVVGAHQSLSREYRIVRHDNGHIRWVRVQAEPTFDRQGNVASLIGTMQDITEHRQNQEARLQSEQKLKTIADNLPAFIAYVGSDDLKYQFANKLYSKGFGLPEDQIIGRHISEILTEDNYRYALPFIEEVRQGRVSGYENTFPLVDGKRWILVKFVPHFDDDGKVRGIVVLSQDISERRSVEETLLVKEWAIASSLNAIAIATLQGVLSYVNPAFLKLWKMDESAVLGRKVSEFWQSGEEASRVAAEVLRTGNWQGELNGQGPDGMVFPVEVTANLVRDNKGEPVCLMAAFLDISERRRDQQRIDKLLEEKELLLMETRHRIKNNLSSIAGLLRLQATSQAQPGLQAALNDAADRVSGMMSLYGKLHEVDHRQALRVREFLPPLLEQVLGLFAAGKTVEVKLDLEDLALDSNLMTSIAIIINELITNSMKHAFPDRADGLITIAIRQTDKRLRIRYHDNGVGMPQPVQPGNSSGFGLRLLHMLVKQIGGTLTIDHDGGTGFLIDCEP